MGINMSDTSFDKSKFNKGVSSSDVLRISDVVRNNKEKLGIVDERPTIEEFDVGGSKEVTVNRFTNEVLSFTADNGDLVTCFMRDDGRYVVNRYYAGNRLKSQTVGLVSTGFSDLDGVSGVKIPNIIGETVNYDGVGHVLSRIDEDGYKRMADGTIFYDLVSNKHPSKKDIKKRIENLTGNKFEEFIFGAYWDEIFNFDKFSEIYNPDGSLKCIVAEKSVNDENSVIKCVYNADGSKVNTEEIYDDNGNIKFFNSVIKNNVTGDVIKINKEYDDEGKFANWDENYFYKDGNERKRCVYDENGNLSFEELKTESDDGLHQVRINYDEFGNSHKSFEKYYDADGMTVEEIIYDDYGSIKVHNTFEYNFLGKLREQFRRVYDDYANLNSESEYYVYDYEYTNVDHVGTYVISNGNGDYIQYERQYYDGDGNIVGTDNCSFQNRNEGNVKVYEIFNRYGDLIQRDKVYN